MKHFLNVVFMVQEIQTSKCRLGNASLTAYRCTGIASQHTVDIAELVVNRVGLALHDDSQRMVL